MNVQHNLTKIIFKKCYLFSLSKSLYTLFNILSNRHVNINVVITETIKNIYTL